MNPNFPYTEAHILAPSYTRKNFVPLLFKELVEKIAAKILELVKIYPEIESIAVCGHSGTILAGALSYSIGIPILVVRKSLDATHDSLMVNGHFGKGYLIVDDLIVSGRTVAKMVFEIEQAARKRNRKIGADGDDDERPVVPIPKPIAALLYNDMCNGFREIRMDDASDGTSPNWPTGLKLNLPCYGGALRHSRAWRMDPFSTPPVPVAKWNMPRDEQGDERLAGTTPGPDDEVEEAIRAQPVTFRDVWSTVDPTRQPSSTS